MDGTNARPAGPAGGRDGEGWGWTPPLAWVGLAMLLAVRGLYSMLTFDWGAELPSSVTAYLQTSVAVAIVNLLWGGWILFAARAGSRALRRGFLTWQSFNLVAIAASVGYTAFVAEFVTTAYGLLIPLVEFGVGIALIVYALKLPDAAATAVGATPSGLAGAPPSTGRYLFNAAVGAIAGAVIGGVAGFPLGALLADVLDISCFEGGCGFFAAGIGLLLIVAGFIVGIVVAVLRTRGKARRPAA
jgi:hypothetical protein